MNKKEVKKQKEHIHLWTDESEYQKLTPKFSRDLYEKLVYNTNSIKNKKSTIDSLRFELNLTIL